MESRTKPGEAQEPTVSFRVVSVDDGAWGVELAQCSKGRCMTNLYPKFRLFRPNGRLHIERDQCRRPVTLGWEIQEVCSHGHLFLGVVGA